VVGPGDAVAVFGEVEAGLEHVGGEAYQERWAFKAGRPAHHHSRI
jgi:hypothetical protein